MNPSQQPARTAHAPLPRSEPVPGRSNGKPGETSGLALDSQAGGVPAQVAPIVNWLYRGLAIRRCSEMSKLETVSEIFRMGFLKSSRRAMAADRLPVANRRYSRLPVGATPAVDDCETLGMTELQRDSALQPRVSALTPTGLRPIVRPLLTVLEIPQNYSYPAQNVSPARVATDVRRLTLTPRSAPGTVALRARSPAGVSPGWPTKL